jgi:hypothetical protein
MRRGLQVVLCSMPFFLTFGGWKLAVFADAALGCSSIGKDPKPCFVEGFDVMPILSPVAWWGMLLWMPSLLVSALLLGRVLAKELPSPWGDKSQNG